MQENLTNYLEIESEHEMCLRENISKTYCMTILKAAKIIF
jgi:hypothetical protein